jgi:ABC-type branched-subunit amino acid transport system ATPase component
LLLDEMLEGLVDMLVKHVKTSSVTCRDELKIFILEVDRKLILE